MHADALHALREALGHDAVTTRWIDRIALSRDASLYRMVPQAVVRPATADQIVSLFVVATRFGLHCTFRAAGTSLSGQAVTDGILVDLSRHWTKIDVLDDGARVRVQPGVTGGRVNATLKRFGTRIGPDPASLIACMIGGIVANNASGMCCGTRYNAYHTIASMRYVLPDGTLIDTAGPHADAALRAASPSIHAGISALRDEIRANGQLTALIRRKYGIKNTVGYSINAFLDEQEPARIIARLMVGSEGTLGFIDEVVFTTIPVPRATSTALFVYDSIDEACATVSFWRDTGAAAVELMDDASLRSFASLATTPHELRITRQGAAALLVEYQDVEPPTVEHAGMWTGWTTDPRRQAVLWHLRKGLMPTIGAMRPSGATMINEDVAVPPERLSSLVSGIRETFARHGYDDGIIFGHAKDGNVHFIVNQRFATDVDVERYRSFMDDIARVVTDLGGSLKAEHGTGRNMAPYVELEWGSVAYDIMRRVKRLLDPRGILSPGVVISDDPDAHVRNIKPVPSIDDEVDRCIECGFCEHVCPTRDHTLTPRQRIALRRELRDANDPVIADAIARDYVYDGVGSCVSDGMCGTVCPVGIDTGVLMKRLRSEQRSPLARDVAARMASRFGIVDGIARATTAMLHGMASVLGEDRLASMSSKAHDEIPEVPKWYATSGRSVRIPTWHDAAADLIYMPACGARWMGEREDASPLALLRTLSERAGLRLSIVDDAASRCCGQVFDSKGLTSAADRVRSDTMAGLRLASDHGRRPIVIDASTCAAAMVEAAGDDLRILDLVGVLHDILMPRLQVTRRKAVVGLHPGCGVAKLHRIEDMIGVASACAERVVVPPSAACCGMAGDAGMRMPELVDTALRRETQEVRAMPEVEAWYAANTTCEIGLSEQFGRPVRTILALVEEATR